MNNTKCIKIDDIRFERLKEQFASNLNISGPFNIQFLSKDNCIKVI